MPNGAEQVRSEPASFSPEALHIVTLKQLDKERLRQITCYVGVMALAPDVRIERIPIDLAQGRKSLTGNCRAVSVGSDDEAPTSCLEAMLRSRRH